MYEQYYGLKEKPFNLTPDPDFLFVNKHFRGALDKVIYGIQRHEGFTAIVGDVGTGKTTLCWALLGRLEKEIRTALILNPLLNEEDMLKAVLQDFGVRPRHYRPAQAAGEAGLPYDPSWMQGLTRKELIDELNYFLLEGAEQGFFNILIVDEAQTLSLGVLEQLRILSNLETAKKKLLQIIFVGQLEFEQKLCLPQLRQLDQRITIRYALKPLAKADVAQYIEHRLSIAGSKRSVAFTKGALRGIYSFSKGYPRLINIICDRSLLAGYSERARVITAGMVRRAARGISGKEKGTIVRLVGWRKLLVPIAGLLLLSLLITLYFWLRHGSLPGLNAGFLKAQPTTAHDPVRPASDALPVASAPATEPAPAAATPAAAAPSTQTSTASSPESNRPAAILTRDYPANPGASGGYLLQLHSLTSRDHADAAVADLKTKGYSVFSRSEQLPQGRQWFVVYAGPFDSLKRALEEAAKLKEQERLSPIIRQ